MPYDMRVDFSPLGDLPKIYREAQQQAQRDAALEQLRANPNIPYDQAARLLIGGGDIAGGSALAGIYNQNAGRDLQQQQITESARHNRATEGQSAATLAETRRQHDIAEAKPMIAPPGAALITREGKQLYQNNSATIDDQTIDDMAQQYRAGDKSVLQNIGRGAQSSENIARLRSAISRQSREAGETPTQLALRMQDFQANAAGLRSLSVRGANLEYAGNTVLNALKLADESIDKVPRSQFLPLNKLTELVARNLNSPAQADLLAKTNTLVNEYANVVTPRGVPTDATRNHAREMLNTAMTPEAFKAVTAAMKQEVDAATRAFHTTRENFRSNGPPQRANSISDFTNATGISSSDLPPPPPGFKLVK